MLKSLTAKLTPVRNGLPALTRAGSEAEGQMTPPEAMTWVVGNIHSPTMDFYFRSRADVFANLVLVDSSALAEQSHPLWLGEHDRVILVRDVPLAIWQKLAKSHNNREIIWFIDDDIPAVSVDESIPKAYRKRLSTWFNTAHGLIGKLCHRIWVSTPYLAEKYQLPSNCILPPRPIGLVASAKVKCFYHGSASHTLEWDFVIPLVKKIQSKYPQVWFELIGDHKLYKRVRDIPRVTVLHPMSWPNYQAHIASRPMDIGFAPLFDSPFNDARSHCKLFDIECQGAIGIFSSQFPYAGVIQEANAGIVAENCIDSWLSAFDVAMNSDRPLIRQNATRLIAELDKLAVI